MKWKKLVRIMPNPLYLRQLNASSYSDTLLLNRIRI